MRTTQMDECENEAIVTNAMHCWWPTVDWQLRILWHGLDYLNTIRSRIRWDQTANFWHKKEGSWNVQCARERRPQTSSSGAMVYSTGTWGAQTKTGQDEQCDRKSWENFKLEQIHQCLGEEEKLAYMSRHDNEALCEVSKKQELARFKVYLYNSMLHKSVWPVLPQNRFWGHMRQDVLMVCSILFLWL